MNMNRESKKKSKNRPYLIVVNQVVNFILKEERGKKLLIHKIKGTISVCRNLKANLCL